MPLNPAEIDRRSGTSYGNDTPGPIQRGRPSPRATDGAGPATYTEEERKAINAQNGGFGPRTQTIGPGIAGGGGLGNMASNSELESFIRSNYGYMGAFLNIPEMRDVLFQAAREGWDEQRLYGAVTQTGWWQSTNAAQRTWTQLTSEDPAEAQRQVQQTAATIMNRARTLGLDPGDVAALATTATANGMTSEQIIDELIRNVNWGSIESGDLTAMRDDVVAIGADYLVGVSATTAQNYAARIASGEMSIDGVRSAMAKQAKARFGWMADELDQGMTVKDYIGPIRDTIARELEMAPEAVNMMDPKWLSMIEVTGEDGKPRAATMNEAMLAARARPEWGATRGAQETTTSMMSMIGDVFGRKAI